MKRSIVLLFAVLMLLSAAGGCTSQVTSTLGAEEEQTIGAPKREGRQEYINQHYILLGYMTSLPGFSDYSLGFSDACDALGVDGEIMSIPNANAASYMRLFETALTKQPDGIICFGMAEIAPLIKKASEKHNIPCVIIEKNLTEELFIKSKALCYVGMSDQMAGKAIARHVQSQLDKDELKVAFLLTSGNYAQEQRKLGCLSVFDRYPETEVVASGEIGYSDPFTAAASATAILLEHPDIDVMIACEPTGGIAISNAMKKLGKAPGSIMVIAFDRDAETLALCKEGYISASIMQKTSVTHFYALQILINYLSQTEAQGTGESAGFVFAPQTVDTGVTIVTQDTVEYYMHETDTTN